MFFMHFRKITLEHCGEQFGKDQTRQWEADGVSAAVTQDGSEPWQARSDSSDNHSEKQTGLSERLDRESGNTRVSALFTDQSVPLKHYTFSETYLGFTQHSQCFLQQ